MNFWEFEIWSSLVSFGVICLFMIAGNILRRKIPFLRKSLIPTAVIGGFLALIFRAFGLLDFISISFLDGITYHTIVIGFIALSLKQNYGKTKGVMMDNERATIKDGMKTGATIVSTYMIQGIAGLAITIVLGTFIYWIFAPGGILLALAFGQGTAQSSNFGRIYEDLGFTGGQSFALSLVSIGFLVSSIVTVIFINIQKKRGKIKVAEIEKSVKENIELDQDDEMPLTEPVDRLTMNIAVIMVVFMITFGFLFGFDRLFIENDLLGDFGVNTVRPMLFGFNFIFGILFAFAFKRIFVTLKRRKIIKHEYTNNQTLNRIGGTMFDFMIIAGIMLIDVSVMSNLIFLVAIMAVAGTIVTFFYIRFAAKHLAKGYENEHFVAMFAMLTGKISTGVAMLRLIDPNFKTKAADNLVLGSFFALLFGFPIMLLLALAPVHPLLTLFILIGAFLVMNFVLFFRIFIKKKRINEEQVEQIELTDVEEVVIQTIE